MANIRLDPSSVAARAEQQVTAALEDEIIVLNMDDSKYYGLNGIGALICRSIDAQAAADGRLERLAEALR
jgi:hypothetical protein